MSRVNYLFAEDTGAIEDRVGDVYPFMHFVILLYYVVKA